MMGDQLGAAALALVAAFCFAASNVLEQRKAVEAPPETSMRLALFFHPVSYTHLTLPTKA